MAKKLKAAFKQREVKKTYLVITKGIPKLKEGMTSFNSCSDLVTCIWHPSAVIIDSLMKYITIELCSGFNTVKLPDVSVVSKLFNAVFFSCTNTGYKLCVNS